MIYIYIIDTSFAFKNDLINEILSTDVKINDDIYNEYFESQSQGKQFKIKNINGVNFEDIFEEVIPTPLINLTSKLTDDERITALEQAINILIN